MSITISTPTLLVILVVVLILALALVPLMSKKRPHHLEEPPIDAVPRRHLTPPSAEVDRTHEKPSEAVTSTHPHPHQTEHKDIDMGDHGADVAHQYGKERSPQWPEVAREHLSHEPACVVCGYTGVGLNVHHIKPFHLFPELELDPNNLITLCQVKGRDHHLLVGHLDNWESYNINVREDTKRFANESAEEIKANPAWQKEELARPIG